MSTSNRRTFLFHVAAAGTALAAASQARAQPAMVNEKDPQAIALGYVTDTTHADAKKYPKHSKDQHCGNCALFGGKPTDASGPCPLFAGKLVHNTGWCSAWAKKA
ncbi:MAG: high-potential iron-sulfur protein [Burkholderiales bacterium]|nr:high-potential iron-sulfur protein [Burkholderiales bacterium]MDE2277043.1 high-potential iron-sulfur protein [Burkholderiales bacterium]